MTLGHTVHGFAITSVQPNAATVMGDTATPYGIEFESWAKLPQSSEQEAAQNNWRKPKVQSMSFLSALLRAGEWILGEQDAPKTFK